jgi:hypothetical protein
LTAFILIFIAALIGNFYCEVVEHGVRLAPPEQPLCLRPTRERVGATAGRTHAPGNTSYRTRLIADENEEHREEPLAFENGAPAEFRMPNLTKSALEVMQSMAKRRRIGIRIDKRDPTTEGGDGEAQATPHTVLPYSDEATVPLIEPGGGSHDLWLQVPAIVLYEGHPGHTPPVGVVYVNVSGHRAPPV